MIESALEDLHGVPKNSAKALQPLVILALKGGTSEQVDEEGARQVIREHVLGLTKQGLVLDREAFERQLALA
jgi:hypothetical protein